MQRPDSETTTLADILITEELSGRASRVPNIQAENQAMRMLIHQMASNAETLLRTLVDTALELCEAGTTGVSLLETTADGEEIFRWNALAGTLAHHVGGSTPRSFSPCGVCLDQGVPVLFSHPEHYFTYFQEANTPIVEGLVLPLIANSHVFGTIWIMSHTEERHFDSEDVRVMTSLADFTATALLLQQRQTRELLAANAALETEVLERKQAESRSRALISNLPGGAAFVVDRDLRYLLAEGEALAIAGFNPADLVGHTIFEAMPPELIPSYERLYRQALSGEPFEHEHDAHDRSFISLCIPLRSETGEVYAVLAVSYDISDRKQAEVALRVSEERLQTAQKAGNVGVWDWDAASKKTYWSETMWTLYGYSRQPDKTGDEIWESSQHPEDQQRVKEGIAEFLASDATDYRDEFRIIQPNGSIRWIEAVAQLSRDAAGKPVRMSGVNIDISDRKQAEAALAHSRRQFEKIAATTPDLVYVFDLVEERNIYVNAGIQQVLGYSQAQIATLGSSLIASLIHPDDIPGVIEGNQRFRDLDDREVYDHELRMRHATGEYRWLRCRDSVFERAADGTVTQTIGTAQDITDRKRAEAALRESEERFRTLANTAPALIWYNDAQGNNLFINQYFLDFTGKSAEEIRGEGWHTLVHPDDAEAYIADYLVAVREQRSWHNRNRIRRHDLF